MKTYQKLLICLLLLTGCEAKNTTNSTSLINSINETPSTTANNVTSVANSTSVIEQGRIVLEKHFSESDSDFKFFQEGWYTANSKFGTNSVILLEDENHKYGAGVVRTKQFEAINNIKVSLALQVTGFNNSESIDSFIGQTFKFGVSLLDENNENVVQNAMVFEHLITKEDCENKCFASLNPYTKDPSEAKMIEFTHTSEKPISKIKIEYLSKPHYTSGTKDNGINLEIFSITIRDNKAN